MTPSQVRAALDAHPHRSGNVLRRVLVEDSRDGAWSVAERLAQQLLRRADITGWKANRGIYVRGSRIVPDIAFPALRVGIEVDGRAFHLSRFEEDRDRQNRLAADGWRVLRLTWLMLTCDPEGVVDTIRRTLAAARR